MITALASARAAHAAQCPVLLDHAFVPLQGGEPQSLCQHRGKVLLIVNTASNCGFTGQYQGLEALYQKYRERGFVVLGFPSNDFGAQEPGNNRQIADFCRVNYGVQFPMFAKTSILPPQTNALHQILAQRTGERPRWNFHKYVIDRNATEVVSFGSSVAPDSRELIATIERMLTQERD